LISPNEFDEKIALYLLPDIDSLARSERITLAVRLVSDFSFSKLKAAKLLGVSRDTIRKKIK
jgi:predicted DNA-binding protein (UPF0251 family)